GAASPGPLDKVPLVPVPAGAGAPKAGQAAFAAALKGAAAGLPAGQGGNDDFADEDDADGVASFLDGITAQ
ncbi:MAG: hypothetical protein II839_13795, partial [Kiritimatiellae bacterium]|nr:hypothetical protein [Kiritimatiellia bacterium]MBQ3811879.1 hypothetical protein [Kiritimatiellia bacterium]